MHAAMARGLKETRDRASVTTSHNQGRSAVTDGGAAAAAAAAVGVGGVIEVNDEDLQAAFQGFVPPAFWGMQRSTALATQVGWAGGCTGATIAVSLPQSFPTAWGVGKRLCCVHPPPPPGLVSSDIEGLGAGSRFHRGRSEPILTQLWQYVMGFDLDFCHLQASGQGSTLVACQRRKGSVSDTHTHTLTPLLAKPTPQQTSGRPLEQTMSDAVKLVSKLSKNPKARNSQA